MTLRYGSWGIIIDDVVFPDGRTAWGQLGGAGLYAAVGMRLWTEEVGIISAVGPEFDPSTLDPLKLDTSGLFVTDLPTPRAWQLFEEDGTRTQIFRVPAEVWYTQLVLPPSPDSIPDTLEAAHYMVRGDPTEEEMVDAFAEANIRLSAEPVAPPTLTEEGRESVFRCLEDIELFSPDAEGLELLVGERPLPDALRALADYGPRVVALRQGAAGSLVYERDEKRFWRVPALPANVVDVTGAGNAYCGGLLIGWLEHNDIRYALAYAAVSAALAIEQVGPTLITPTVEAQAQHRAEQVLPLIQPLA